MSRMKIMLAGLLAMLALGSVASATASAALQGGPWWRHPETKGSQKQVKWPMNEEKEVKGENEGAFVLTGTVLSLHAVVTCNKVTGKGNVWNGLHQGEDNTSVEFSECNMSAPCKGAAKVAEVKAYTELMWKYRGEKKELEEPGQQKIYDVFAPTAEAKEGKAEFTSITGPEGTLCASKFPVEAKGSAATFVDQNQAEHKIVWGTATLVEPQNEDALVGHLNWVAPNVNKLHHQEKEVLANLELAGSPAELTGRFKIERSGVGAPEEFGAYNE